MANTYSTGLVNAMMASSSLKAALEGGAGFVIDIYAGTRPADADTAPDGTATKLLTLYSDGTATGCRFAATATAGTLPKATGETWSGTTAAAGVAAWFRVRPTTDPGTTSTTVPRIDGSIATSGADMNLSNTNIVLGAPLQVASFSITLPQS